MCNPSWLYRPAPAVALSGLSGLSASAIVTDCNNLALLNIGQESQELPSLGRRAEINDRQNLVLCTCKLGRPARKSTLFVRNILIFINKFYNHSFRGNSPRTAIERRGGHVSTSIGTSEQDLRNPANPLLDVHGLAALLGVSAQSIPAQRSRTPHKLPPPFLTRPLRWRREAVVQWMQKQEHMEVARAAEQLRTGDRPARRRGTARVIQVCVRYGTRARGSRWSSRPAIIGIIAFRARSLGTVTRCAA